MTVKSRQAGMLTKNAQGTLLKGREKGNQGLQMRRSAGQGMAPACMNSTAFVAVCTRSSQLE